MIALHAASAADAPPLPFAATSEDETDADSSALPYRWDYDDDDPLRFLPLIWLSVPLLIANLLLAKDQTIFAEDRYLLFLSPFALWLIAEGVVWLWALWKGKRLKHLSDEHPFAGIGGLLVTVAVGAVLYAAVFVTLGGLRVVKALAQARRE